MSDAPHGMWLSQTECLRYTRNCESGWLRPLLLLPLRLIFHEFLSNLNLMKLQRHHLILRAAIKSFCPKCPDYILHSFHTIQPPWIVFNLLVCALSQSRTPCMDSAWSRQAKDYINQYNIYYIYIILRNYTFSILYKCCSNPISFKESELR